MLDDSGGQGKDPPLEWPTAHAFKEPVLLRTGTTIRRAVGSRMRLTAVAPASGVRLRTAGNRPPLVPFAPAASSTRFDRLPSRHAPALLMRASRIARTELAASESLCPISGFVAACGRYFAVKRRAPNGRPTRARPRRCAQQ